MMVQYAKQAWAKFWSFLDERADQHVAAWGSALQYKRRYTNPEDAVAYRKSFGK